MKFRNKTWFLTVVIALAHVYCSIKIAKTINQHCVKLTFNRL